MRQPAADGTKAQSPVMARHKPLDSLQRLAAHAASSASREVAARLQVLRGEEARLTQIGTYADQYEAGSAVPGASLTVGTLLGRRRFAARLREAATHQQQVVTEETTRYRLQVERWREARAQSLALQRLNERLRRREEEHEARAEQRILDEIGSRPRRG